MAPPPPRPSIEDGLLALGRRWPELVDRDDEDTPVFILAAGWRSGSTLLQRLLSERRLIWGEPYGHAWPIPSMSDQRVRPVKYIYKPAGGRGTMFGAAS